MRKENGSLTQKLFIREGGDNTQLSEILDYYSKVSDIVERTYAAMGKKSSFRIVSSSTTSEKLYTNVFSSTH
jgi:hypothetical protein